MRSRTVTLQTSSEPPAPATMISQVPGATAVTAPPSSTVATDASELRQVTRVSSAQAGTTFARSRRVTPGVRSASWGEISTLTTSCGTSEIMSTAYSNVFSAPSAPTRPSTRTVQRWFCW